MSKTYLTRGLMAAGLASAFVLGGATIPADKVRAEAVKIEQPVGVTDFADVVETVSPAVVSVRVTGRMQNMAAQGQGQMPGLDMLPRDHPFRRFFEGPRGREFGQRRNERRGENRRRNRPMGQGSGFFVSEDGYIVTNNHVIENGREFIVVMNDGTELEAELVGADPRTDLAVLKVDEDREFKYVAFDDEAPRVGSWVVAVGNPFGLGGTVTAGIVSANGRDIGAGPYDDFIQIDAAVNRGNSGGPTFNLAGEVVGVNTAIFSPSGGNVGIAFAISAKTADKVVSSLIEDGSVTRGWLGVQIQPVTEDIASATGLDEAKGAIVSDAQTESPATKAGVTEGDVIVAVDDREIDNPRDLARTIASYAPNTKIALKVVRGGEEQVIDVTLGKLPKVNRQASAQPTTPEPSAAETTALEDFGLELTDGDDGVTVVEVEADSAADEKRLQAGDVIVSVNGTETKDVKSVGKAVADAMGEDRKAILFQVRSGDRSRFVALPVAKG